MGLEYLRAFSLEEARVWPTLLMFLLTLLRFSMALTGMILHILPRAMRVQEEMVTGECEEELIEKNTQGDKPGGIQKYERTSQHK